MLLGILHIYPSAIRELSTMIFRVLIFDNQISALEKTFTQGDVLTHLFPMYPFSTH